MDKNREAKGHLLAVITIFIWGTTFISTKLLLKTLTPVEILWIRFLIGFIALWITYPKRLRLKNPNQEWYFAGAGLCGITLYYLLENIALTYTRASNVGVIISIAPFFTAILAHILLKGERLKLQFLLGFFISISGIILISWNGYSVLKISPKGDILAVLAAAVWACYSIITKKIGEFQYNTIQTTRRTFFYGLLFMIPALFLFDFQPNIWVLVSYVNLFNILFLGLGASALCFVTWNSAVFILGAVKTSVYIYMVPVITVITSVIVLKEEITGITIFGIILTLVGLFLSEEKLFYKIRKEVSL